MRRFFLTGLLVLLPLAITVYLLVAIFIAIDTTFGNLLVLVVGRPIPGAGAALTLLLIFGTGIVATNVIGRKLIRFGESLLLKVPIARNLYQGTQQILQALSQAKHKDAFKRVVLLEYPRTGLHSIAFITNECQGELQARVDEPSITVFVPTTPNPTSGFFLIVPRSECQPLDMSVEEAFKLIISAGALVPPWHSPTVPNPVQKETRSENKL